MKKTQPIMPKEDTQEWQVLMHIMKKPLSAMEAFDEYDITDLAGRICRLKEKGWIIKRTYCKRKNRKGKTRIWKEYSLEGLKRNKKAVPSI